MPRRPMTAEDIQNVHLLSDHECQELADLLVELFEYTAGRRLEVRRNSTERKPTNDPANDSQ